MGGIIERQKEIKRRRTRRKKYKLLQRRLEKASVSEKAVIAAKIRRMGIGAEAVIANFGLAER